MVGENHRIAIGIYVNGSARIADDGCVILKVNGRCIPWEPDTSYDHDFRQLGSVGRSSHKKRVGIYGNRARGTESDALSSHDIERKRAN